MKQIVRTDHYSFELNIEKETTGPLSKYILTVGSAEKPCLHAIIPLKPENNNDVQRFYTLIKYATLTNIDALYECFYMKKHSFGKEMLESVIRVITNIRELSHITHIQLTDKSYMPCNRPFNDTLDLITYSIALYGKTWYEAKFRAIQYPEDNPRLQIYDEAITKYLSPATKDTLLFDELYAYISVRNEYATKHISEHLGDIRKRYEHASTLPEFFIALSKSLEPTNRGRFFKTWLEHFIAERIPINRTWFIPIRHSLPCTP
jgi:hypothetical protein